jgi:hypothetical protein
MMMQLGKVSSLVNMRPSLLGVAQSRRSILPNTLKELELGELSLVDNPANPLAKAPLFKRDSQGDQMEQEIETLKADFDAMKAENERLRKGLIENGFVIKADVIEKKATEEQIEVGGEMVNKSAIPAPVLKALEEAEVAKRDVELTKAAQEKLPNWDEAVAKELMKFDLDDKIMEALMAADAAFEAVMTEKGQDSAADDLSNPEDKLNELAKSKKAEYGTFEKAYAAVVKTDEGKALLKAMKEDK